MLLVVAASAAAERLNKVVGCCRKHLLENLVDVNLPGLNALGLLCLAVLFHGRGFLGRSHLRGFLVGGLGGS